MSPRCFHHHGIVSTGAGWKAALYASGSKHAGENLAEILIVNLRAGRRKTDYIGVKIDS